MAVLRFDALKQTLNRKPIKINENKTRSELFGKNVFNEGSMRQYLTKMPLRVL